MNEWSPEQAVVALAALVRAAHRRQGCRESAPPLGCRAIAVGEAAARQWVRRVTRARQVRHVEAEVLDLVKPADVKLKLGDAQLIYSPTRLFRTEVHCHISRALPAGIEPTTQRVAGCCSTNSTNDPCQLTYILFRCLFEPADVHLVQMPVRLEPRDRLVVRLQVEVTKSDQQPSCRGAPPSRI